MFIGPFHDKIFSAENTPLLGQSSQILSSIMNKNSNISQLGKPTSSFWSCNGVPNFYDSMGYPIEDFVSPSLCLVYGDPKGKEFIKKMLLMGPQTENQGHAIHSSWVASKLLDLADEMTLGGHSFMKCIESFKDSVLKTTNNMPELQSEKPSQSNVNLNAQTLTHNTLLLSTDNSNEGKKVGESSSNEFITYSSTATDNDKLLHKISSLLLKTTEIKSQLLYSRNPDPNLTSNLGSLTSELKEKLAQVAKLCSPTDLLGPRYVYFWSMVLIF